MRLVRCSFSHEQRQLRVDSEYLIRIGVCSMFAGETKDSHVVVLFRDAVVQPL